MDFKIYQDREKIKDTGSQNDDYRFLFPQTVSQAVIHKNNFAGGNDLNSVINYFVDRLNDVSSKDLDQDIDTKSPSFTESDSLIELFEGDSLSTMLGKLAKSVTELRSLLQFVGTTGIENIGDGTVTGAISFLNSQYTSDYSDIEAAIDNVNRVVI